MSKQDTFLSLSFPLHRAHFLHSINAYVTGSDTLRVSPSHHVPQFICRTMLTNEGALCIHLFIKIQAIHKAVSCWSKSIFKMMTPLSLPALAGLLYQHVPVVHAVVALNVLNRMSLPGSLLIRLITATSYHPSTTVSIRCTAPWLADNFTPSSDIGSTSTLK